MSLISELSNKDSWVNRFFKVRCPNINGFVRDNGDSVKSMPTEVPPLERSAARTIGTAFAYRLRLHYGGNMVEADAMDL